MHPSNYKDEKKIIAFTHNRIRKFRGANKIEFLIFSFSILLAFSFTLTPRLYSLSYGNIDPSFNYGVDEAAAAGKSFGDEFISTYGPLGYIVTNYMPTHIVLSSAALVIYGLLLGVGIYLFTRLYIGSTRKKIYVIPVLLYALTITNSGGSIEWGYLMTYLLYCLVLIKASNFYRFPLLLLLSIVAAVFSLTKFTLGFSSIVTLLLVCVFSLKGARESKLKYLALTTAVYLVTLFGLGHYFGISNFTQYIKTAVIESGNFSSAMSQYDKQTFMATIFVAGSLLLLLLWPLLNEKKITLKYLFISPALCTIWKYSVVRQDGHLFRLLQVSIPIAVILYYTYRGRSSVDRWIMASVFFLTSMAVFANKLPFYGPNSFFAVVTSPVENVKKAGPYEFLKFGKQKAEWAVQSGLGLQDAALPKSMLDKIGLYAVDVFPWEAAIVAANNLHWDNRPSPFSFESYDPYLDNLNSAFYAAGKAPKYIIWHNTGAFSIDGRHVLWDEPKTFRTILSNYDVIENDTNFMLLGRRDQTEVPKYNVISLGNLRPSIRKIAQKDKLNSEGLLFASFNVDIGILDVLETNLVRGDTYFLTVKTTNGQIQKYRLLIENTSQGILISPLPSNWEELVLLMTGQHSAYSSVESIELSKGL